MISQLLSRHRDQFVAMGLPTHLHQSACQKIISQTFDAGTFFQFREASDDFEACEEHGTVSSDDQDVMEEDSIDEGIGHALLTKYALASCSHLKGEGTVILIDHMWLVAYCYWTLYIERHSNKRTQTYAVRGYLCECDTLLEGRPHSRSLVII